VSDPVSSNGHSDTTQESLDVGMQILHGETIAPFVQDAFSGGSIAVTPDLAVTVTHVEVPGATESAFGILGRVFPMAHPVLVLPTGSEAVAIPLEALADLELDEEDWDNLAEELGDLFLLVAMHAQIAEEAGRFSLEDVYEHITTKIIRRHPHVFGDVEAGDPEAVVATWNEVKAQEKAAKPPRREKDADGQPFSMPALTRAARVLKKRPLPEGGTMETPGDSLLRMVADLVEAGQDPEVVLRDALNKHLNS
jgi:hypothetical protein